MSTDNRTTPDYWQKETGDFRPFKVGGSPFASILEKYLPVDHRLTCVEVGAYPGGNLLYLTQQFGYRPFAIEYRSDADDIRRLFEFNDARGPDIIQGDFLDLEVRQFDVVASFGFVEHFNDPQVVIKRHADFLRPGSYLVLTVPHFWGMQGLFRKMVFTREALAELYATHNMEIMNMNALRKALSGLELEILFLGHVMNGRFWISDTSPKIRPDRRWLAKGMAVFDRKVGSKLPSCGLVSPMILAIAKKPGGPHAD